MDVLNFPFTIYRIICSKYEILHLTHYSVFIPMFFLRNKKLVVTMHDMNHTKFPELYSKNFFHNPNKFQKSQKKYIERADCVISVSESTKNDLVNIWGINEKKIKVIYHGIDQNLYERNTTKSISDYPYILFVGERNGFKNFNIFIEAFSKLSKIHTEYILICTGKAFSIDEMQRLKELDIFEKTKLFYCNEDEMINLYKNADMFVYPSISEGFGMPILEAMSLKCPVVLSNSSCFPEIADNAGLFFNPFSVDDMCDKMNMLLTDSILRENLISKGIKRASFFSWDKSASEHLEVYNNLI